MALPSRILSYSEIVEDERNSKIKNTPETHCSGKIKHMTINALCHPILHKYAKQKVKYFYKSFS